MPPFFDLALIPLSVGSLLAVMALVRWVGPRWKIGPELQRKLVHVATGLYALTLPFTFETAAAVLLLIIMSVLVLGVLRLPSFAKGGLASAVHAVERKSYGEIYLALAVGLLFWRANDELVLFVLPILVLTLSDAAAALAGTRYGSRHFQVEAGTKSWEGVAIFFMVTLIISMALLLLMTEIDRPNVIVLSLMIAAFGALVEADSWGGLDNLFVPVGIHLLLISHLRTPPLQLAALAAAFIVALILIVNYGKRLGLTAHGSRAYVVLLFLISAVTAPHNAILPALAVLAHIAARALNPCRSQYPDLDMIAVSAGVSLFWLFTGEFFDRNALNVYNLTFAAMATLFVAASLGRAAPLLRAAGTAAAGLFFGKLVLEIAPLNLDSAAWDGWFTPWVGAALAVAALVGVVLPSAFDRFRSVRALALAAPLPLVLFVWKGLLA